jgi:hypothetical protein
MASSYPTIAMRTAIAAAVLSFVAGVYSVGPISSWLRSALDDAATFDTNAHASDSGPVKTVAPSGLQSVVLNDKGNCGLSQEAGHEVVGTYQRPQSL